MLKHIVMWQLREDAAEKDLGKNAAELKEKLEALMGKIPGLLKLEVAYDLSVSSDIVLYSELESRKTLASYQAHPEHQAVIPLVKSLCTARRVVDYEV